MQMCLGLVAGPPKVKLFLNWFYCAHKYSMPISAVATEDSVTPATGSRHRKLAVQETS